MEEQHFVHKETGADGTEPQLGSAWPDSHAPLQGCGGQTEHPFLNHAKEASVARGGPLHYCETPHSLFAAEREKILLPV